MGDLSLTHLADGIVRLAVARMATATREVSIRRGHDPRDFTLVAFGGAGPMHACSLAAELGIPRVLVPPSPGNFSALGLLTADVRHDFVKTRLALQRDLPAGEAERLFEELEKQARAQLATEGFKGERIRLERSADIRYAGQAWEVNVPLPTPAPEGAALRKRFDAAYAAIYGHQGAPDEEIQLVRLRLSAFGVIDKPKLATVPDDTGAQPFTVRSVYFEGAFQACPVWDRGNLGRGARIAGPAIVEEFGSTTVVPPGWDGVVDEFGNLVFVTK
jgi:N-methylhydantoinase A